MLWQYVAIHAGKRYDEAIDDHWLAARGVDVMLPQEIVAGAIVGVARVVGVVELIEEVPEPQRPWWFGPLAWLRADVVPIEPVVCRGDRDSGCWSQMYYWKFSRPALGSVTQELQSGVSPA
jgi:hypothetical protein